MIKEAKKLESIENVMVNMEYSKPIEIVYKDAFFEVDKLRMIYGCDCRPCYIVRLCRKDYNDPLIENGYLYDRYETYYKAMSISQIFKFMDLFINDEVESE